jgi:hypothetical protein
MLIIQIFAVSLLANRNDYIKLRRTLNIPKIYNSLYILEIYEAIEIFYRTKQNNKAKVKII